MIKSKKLNNIRVTPFWNRGQGERKPVRELHALITTEPFPNIICTARKFAGKTTAGLFMLRHFMTNKTKLVIFSPDLEHDKHNSKIIKMIRKQFGDDSVVIYKSFTDQNGDSYFLNEIDDAGERFDLDNNSKWEYPRTIFYFDDLPHEDLKSKDLGHFAQNNRHYGALCIYSSQDWMNFEPRIRKNCDLLLLWASIPKMRLKDIYDTIQPGIDFDEFVKIYIKAVAEPKSFLFIDVVKKLFRQNFDTELFVKNI